MLSIGSIGSSIPRVFGTSSYVQTTLLDGLFNGTTLSFNNEPWYLNVSCTSSVSCLGSGTYYRYTTGSVLDFLPGAKIEVIMPYDNVSFSNANCHCGLGSVDRPIGTPSIFSFSYINTTTPGGGGCPSIPALGSNEACVLTSVSSSAGGQTGNITMQYATFPVTVQGSFCYAGMGCNGSRNPYYICWDSNSASCTLYYTSGYTPPQFFAANTTFIMVVANALSDDTFLTGFSVSGHWTSMSGYSSNCPLTLLDGSTCLTLETGHAGIQAGAFIQYEYEGE